MIDLSELNVAGWILILVTIVASLVIGVPLMYMISDALPAGSYPRIIFMLPTLAVGLVVFVVGRLTLSLLKIKITRS